MTSARGAIVATAFVLAAGAFGWASTRVDRAIADRPRISVPFVLCASHGKITPATTISSPDVTSALALALGADERRDLLHVLDGVNERLVGLENPLFTTLDDGDPDAPLAAWSRRGPSAVGVAASASRTHACATDALCARIARDRCPDGWTDATASDHERARFLVWAWGYARVVHTSSEARSAEIAKSLREDARTTPTLGLVMTARDGRDAKEVAGDLVEAWTRHRMLRSLHAGEAASPSAQDAPRAAIDPRDVLVLPAAPALTDEAAFDAAIRLRTGSESVRRAVP